MKKIIILLVALVSVASACVKFEPKIQYTEPDETWFHATFDPDCVISYDMANSKRGYVYWMVYTDPDCAWNNQIISMDKETMGVLFQILQEEDYYKRLDLIEEYEPVILYKEHYQPVLVLTDKD